MEAAAATQPSTRAWSDLSPDLLLDISGRLHDAADFVRFHAVCTSWRHRLHSSATCPKFLPWPLSQCNDGQIVHSPAIYSRRVDVSSEVGGYDGNILTEPKGVSSTRGGGRNFVASADGSSPGFASRDSSTLSREPSPPCLPSHTTTTTGSGGTG